jgi:aconitate decarboxylase
MIQAFELDDWHSVAPCHIAAIVLPALFAAAEQGKATLSTVCTGADFLLAALVGYEVSPRVGKAIYGGELLARGIHSGAGALAAPPIM